MTMATKPPSPFSDELLDQILAGYTKPEDLTGKDGILKQLTARLVERALQTEMTDHFRRSRVLCPRRIRAAGSSPAPRPVILSP